MLIYQISVQYIPLEPLAFKCYQHFYWLEVSFYSHSLIYRFQNHRTFVLFHCNLLFCHCQVDIITNSISCKCFSTVYVLYFLDMYIPYHLYIPLSIYISPLSPFCFRIDIHLYIWYNSLMKEVKLYASYEIRFNRRTSCNP